MAKNVTIAAELRTEFGKGAARRVRRAHKVPAVLYGHGTAPVHLTLPGHEMMMAVKTANAVVTLVIDGKEQLALVKDVQRDILRPILEHIDLVVIRRGEKVTVDVPVSTTGDAVSDAVVTVESQTLSVLAEATHIPSGIEVDVEGLEIGTQILAGQIRLPGGVELAADPETLVVNITVATAEVEAEPVEGEGEGDAAGAGDEGGHDAAGADKDDAQA